MRRRKDRIKALLELSGVDSSKSTIRKVDMTLIAYDELQALFIIKPPYIMPEREQLFTLLREHTSLDEEICRQIAITGEATPYLLSVSREPDRIADWVNRLESLGLPILCKGFLTSEEPMEAVFVSGRIPELRQVIEFCKWWNERYPEHRIPHSEYANILHGVDVLYLGSVEVRDTRRDRDPLVQKIESYGLKVLAWVDIRDPWVD